MKNIDALTALFGTVGLIVAAFALKWVVGFIEFIISILWKLALGGVILAIILILAHALF